MGSKTKKRRIVILGAAGRDFHNFLCYFKDNEAYEVVAFTATQIPNIEGRKFPASLAGKLYPRGIPIFSESELSRLIKDEKIDAAVFAYSDVSYEYVMHRAAMVNSLGANFMMLGARDTQLKSKKPVISICAVRTGSGKSQTARRVAQILRDMGKKVVVVRHPMPYGNLEEQAVQRFAAYSDLDKYKCTIEEREEYEPHVDRGVVVYAGVDYERILRRAEKEADVILWDGGNNDIPFLKSDLHIVVADPHRAGHELLYYPSETNVRMADVVVINKVDTASPENIKLVRENVKRLNPDAVVIEAASPFSVDDPERVRGKRVLVIEDGPTLTHGEMRYGIAYIAAEKLGAAEIVDAEVHAVNSIKKMYERYGHLHRILPAMGYGPQQIKELEESINRTPCDLVLSGTPIDLNRILRVNKPVIRVRYNLEEWGKPTLKDVLRRFA